MEPIVEQLAGVMLDELSGVSTKAQQLQVIKVGLQKTANAVNAASVKSTPNPGKVKFLQRVDELDPNEKLALESGQRAWDFFNKYRRFRLTGGDQIVWDQTNTKSTGVSNLDENTLEQGTSYLISTVSLRWAYDPTGTVTDVTSLEYKNFGSFPPALQNSELTVRLGGRVIIERLPIVNLLAPGTNAGQTSIDIEDTGYDLRKDNALWRSKEPIEVVLHQPVAALPTGWHFAEIMFSGPGIRNRY